jgi:hypothetical protein
MVMTLLLASTTELLISLSVPPVFIAVGLMLRLRYSLECGFDALAAMFLLCREFAL